MQTAYCIKRDLPPSAVPSRSGLHGCCCNVLACVQRSEQPLVTWRWSEAAIAVGFCGQTVCCTRMAIQEIDRYVLWSVHLGVNVGIGGRISLMRRVLP